MRYSPKDRHIKYLKRMDFSEYLWLIDFRQGVKTMKERKVSSTKRAGATG